MKKVLLLIVVMAFMVFLVPSVAEAVCNGVTICGVNYTCGVSDGVCPEDFSVCDKCSTCDPDCGSCEKGVGAAGGGGNYQCSNEIEMYYIDSLSANQIFKTVEDRYCTDLHLYKLTTNKDVSSISTVIKLISPEVIPPEGKVYNYYNVSLERASNDVVKAITFRFRVPIEWVSNNSIDKNKVVLYKQKRVFWERLDTSLLKEDGIYYYYGSESNSLDSYAIVGQGLTIWDVLEKLNLYYTHKIEFGEVLHTIDKYYSFNNL